MKYVLPNEIAISVPLEFLNGVSGLFPVACNKNIVIVQNIGQLIN